MNCEETKGRYWVGVMSGMKEARGAEHEGADEKGIGSAFKTNIITQSGTSFLTFSFSFSLCFVLSQLHVTAFIFSFLFFSLCCQIFSILLHYQFPSPTRLPNSLFFTLVFPPLPCSLLPPSIPLTFISPLFISCSPKCLQSLPTCFFSSSFISSPQGLSHTPQFFHFFLTLYYKKTLPCSLSPCSHNPATPHQSTALSTLSSHFSPLSTTHYIQSLSYPMLFVPTVPIFYLLLLPYKEGMHERKRKQEDV